MLSSIAAYLCQRHVSVRKLDSHGRRPITLDAGNRMFGGGLFAECARLFFRQWWGFAGSHEAVQARLLCRQLVVEHGKAVAGFDQPLLGSAAGENLHGPWLSLMGRFLV